MRTQDALQDIWPFVYQLIHPSIREVSPALFRADEVLAQRMAIELMVAFDIELKSSSSATHLP